MTISSVTLPRQQSKHFYLSFEHNRKKVYDCADFMGYHTFYESFYFQNTKKNINDLQLLFPSCITRL